MRTLRPAILIGICLFALSGVTASATAGSDARAAAEGRHPAPPAPAAAPEQPQPDATQSDSNFFPFRLPGFSRPGTTRRSTPTSAR